MKIIRSLFAGITGILAAFTLSSCGAPDTESSTVMMHATIIHAQDGYILFLPSESDGSIPNAGSVYSTGLEEVRIVDEDGNAFQPEELVSGQIVDVIYDGSIRETYPASITCSEVRLVGQQPEEWQCPIDVEQFLTKPDPDDPYANMPSMGVECRTGEIVSYTFSERGTSSWAENGEGICVDSILPVHEKARERIPEIDAAEDVQEVKLVFSKEPDEISVTCWNWDEFSETGLETEPLAVSLDGEMLSLPTKTGSYLFEVSGNWPEGNVLYYFTINCP